LFANHLSVEQGLRPCYYWDEALTIPIMEGEISWGNQFCDWAADGYRLPSEGEWEYFCRAGTTSPFAVDEPNYTHCLGFCTPGDLPGLESIAWYCANQNDEAGNGTSKPVGMKDPNPWNLYDVHGNVREWCWDRWDYASPYPAGPLEDYRGLTSGSYRMLRGGSWDRSALDARSAKRYANYPHGRSWRRGFRLCRTVR
jgi:formylglycine-generating enzyme required for sulfatase activity